MTPGDRIAKSLVRYERLAQREGEHGARIRKAATAMADHATGAADALRKRALAGDADAAAQYQRALLGRAYGRRLA